VRSGATLLGPILQCIWRIETSSHRADDAADSHVVDWARGHNLLPTAALERKFEATRPGDLAARCYPSAPEPVLFLAADWLAWLFVFDDLNDEGPLGRDPAELSAFTENLRSGVFDQPMSNPGDPLTAALSDIWHRIRGRSSSAWRDRFEGHVADYLDACVWQAAQRATRNVPGMRAFREMRRRAGAIWPSFDLIELAVGQALPESVCRDRTYRRLTMQAADVVCWTNDLMTFEKELAHDDMHNMVLVTKARTGCSLQDARRSVEKMVERSVDGFLETEARLPELCAQLGLRDEQRDVLFRCVAQLRSWMRGHVDWSWHTIRYRVQDVGDQGVGGVE
jgi:hypothetical protein